jgi:hypothetical protein
MKKILAFAAIGVLGVASAANAELVINLDTDTDGANPVTFSFNQDTPGDFATIEWDLTHEAFSPSWGSEVRIVLQHVDTGTIISMGGGDDASVMINFGFPNASGVFSTNGVATAADLGLAPFETLGEWLVTVDESFDDFGIDGHLTGTIIINKIPAPGALALFGLVGLAGGRRRRA